MDSAQPCFVGERTLKEAILWYSDKPVARRKKVFMHGRYFAVSMQGKKIHVHRLVMMYKLKRKLLRGEYVHHKNGDTRDNKLSNLKVMTASKHQSITNKGRKQSPEWIKDRITKMADSKRGKKYPKKIYENPNLLS